MQKGEFSRLCAWSKMNVNTFQLASASIQCRESFIPAQRKPVECVQDLLDVIPQEKTGPHLFCAAEPYFADAA